MKPQSNEGTCLKTNKNHLDATFLEMSNQIKSEI